MKNVSDDCKREELFKRNKTIGNYNDPIYRSQCQIPQFIPRNNESIYSRLPETHSKLFSNAQKNKTYSVYKNCWIPIQEDINILGPKHPITYGSLEKSDFILDSNKLRISTGPLKGKSLSEFIGGKLNKACRGYTDNEVRIKPKLIKTSSNEEAITPHSTRTK
jgi:hypothetical protein